MTILSYKGPDKNGWYIFEDAGTDNLGGDYTAFHKSYPDRAQLDGEYTIQQLKNIIETLEAFKP